MSRSVFISHSSKKNQETKELCDVLIPALKDANYQVLFDAHIIPTDSWENRLTAWLGRCDAAVIILSPEALKSEWVLLEATILKWRHSLMPGFPIFIYLLPSLKQSDLELASLPFRELSKIQSLNRDRNLTPERIVQDILDLLSNTQFVQKGPFYRLETYLAQRLKSIPHNIVEEELEGWSTEHPPHQIWPYENQLARIMMEMSLRELSETMEKIADFITPRIHAREIIDALWYFWVEPAAAAELVSICQMQGQSRVTAINTRSPETVKAYIQRAFCRTSPWPIADLTGINFETGMDYIQEVNDTIARKLSLPLNNLNPGEQEQTIKKFLKFLSSDRHVFIRIPFNAFRLYENLSALFDVTYIITGNEEEIISLNNADLRLITPRLSADEEEVAIFNRSLAYQVSGIDS